MISSSFSSYLGGLLTFFELILSALFGMFILKNFQFSLMDSIMELRSNNITQEDFVKTNIARALGAVLLILPGFFTDILGVMLQFSFFIVLGSKAFRTTVTKTEYRDSYDKKYDGEVIDVEVIDDSKCIK